MNTICITVREYSEILPELRRVLGSLRDDLIADTILWI